MLPCTHDTLLFGGGQTIIGTNLYHPAFRELILDDRRGKPRRYGKAEHNLVLDESATETLGLYSDMHVGEGYWYNLN